MSMPFVYMADHDHDDESIQCGLNSTDHSIFMMMVEP